MSKTFRCAVITAMLLIAACGRDSGEAEPVAGPEDALNQALALISRENIQEMIEYLAADEREGRMTGTQGYDDSAQYVADRFAEIGLEPGGTDSWMQPIPFITRLLDADRSGVIIHRPDGDTALAYREDMLVYADPLRPETTVRAEVVFAGFGVHAPELGYSDYEDVDVEGKIVAIFRGAPADFPSTERAHYSSGRTKTEEMVRRGAVGQIGLLSRLEEERSPWEDYTRNLGTQPDLSWIDQADQVADFHPEILGSAMLNVPSAALLFADAPLSFDAARDAAADARPASAPLGVEVSISRSTEHERITSSNVVGMLRGSDPDLADEYIVYSTHLDHLGVGEPVNGDGIYNGMYDNALGVAFTIEIARALRSLTVAPRRSILFVAVTAEEHGLLGSDYFAQNPTVPADDIVANVNIDMPMMLFPMRTVVGYGAQHSSLEALAQEEVAKEGFEMEPDPYPDEVYFIRSDQYSFVKQGVPAVFLVPGFTSSDPDIDGQPVWRDFLQTHYHQPSDDLTRPIDWPSAERFARANVRIGFAIANDDARPTWNEGDFFGEKFGR